MTLPSETALLWIAGLGTALAIWVPYARAHRQRVRRDFERRQESLRLALDRPVGQFPYIDPLRCVGCSACVDACPEGDVLAVVRGTAVIANGLRCIGIAECEEACPVGAIEVGLGDIKARADIPRLDAALQTNLPGVFVAGELGGLSLVRFAVEQGQQAVRSVRQFLETSGTEEEPPQTTPLLDLLIVGAGPAGLSAALAATSEGLTYRIIERERDLGGTVLHYPRRKMVLTQPVGIGDWGSLDRQSYEKEDLLATFQSLADSASVRVTFGESLTGLKRVAGHYLAETSSSQHAVSAVLLALGRRGEPRRLGVPGEELSKVTYRLVDAESFVDCDLLVVGGGDSAVEAAIALANGGRNRVTLSYRKERLVRIKARNQELIEPLLHSGKIRGAMASTVVSITPQEVELQEEGVFRKIPNDHVFVCIGGDPPFRFLKELGVEFGGEEMEPR